MLISLNAIKKYVNIPASVSNDDLLSLIGSRLVEIEEVVALAPKYQGAYVVKVTQAEPIAGTHLNLCQIDAGPVTADFSDTDTVQVVCGAPNVHAGMLAVWLTPGSIVPSTYGHEDFRLGKRKLQGYESHGMLAGADELDFDNEHKSIAEIDPKLSLIDTESGEARFVRPGDTLVAALDLDDLIIDVENKSLTHRPDCFGLVGFAREVAGILGQPFQEPDWLSCTTLPAINQRTDITLDVTVDPTLCPRYSCAVFDLPKHTPSKYLTPAAVFLAKAGMRAIDPLVDMTNIIMLETGQPLHAFDYDKLVAVGQTTTPQIIVRAATDGEPLQLLDGKTIACTTDDILITSNDVPIALAGAMGGKNTEIDASTTRVVLESATFSLYHLRKTQMAHGIFSEAITRFTKGQPAAMTLPVLSETIRRLDTTPLALADAYPDPVQPITIKLTAGQINDLLGTDYSVATITKTLANVGFVVATKSATLSITAPLWRTDIHIPEDIIEEVGRLLGFDNIPLSLPSKPFRGTTAAPLWSLKQTLRHILSDRLAAHELLTYSFVSHALLEKVGQDPADSYEIVNSISPDLQSFRQQIAPSLLDKVRENIKSGHRAFTLYEFNQVTTRSLGLTAENVPQMENHLGIVHLGDFYELKAQLLATARSLGVAIEYAAMGAHSAAARAYPYLEPAHSVVITANGVSLGAFGEIKASVLRRFKLDPTIAAAELSLDQLVALPRTLTKDLHISRFPFVERDLTLKVAASAPYGRFDQAIRDTLAHAQLISETTPVSIYQAAPDTKHLSFHLKFSSPNKTLTQPEISAIIDKITAAVVGLGAEII